MTIPSTTDATPPTPPDHPALRFGVNTSEFWVTVITLVLSVIGAFVPDTVAQRWAHEHGWIAGLVVAVYIAARAYVKATALKVL